MKFFYLTLFSLSLIAAGCKKYPEDSGLMLKTPMGRLEGKWALTEINFDNNNLTSNYIRDGFTCEYEFYKRKDTENNTSLKINCPACYQEEYVVGGISNSLPTLNCNFNFEERKKSLRIYGPVMADSLVRDTGAFLMMPKADFVIRSLTKTDMYLQTTINGFTTSLRFEKK